MISVEVFAPSFSLDNFVKDSSVDILYVISLKLFLDPLQKFSVIGGFSFLSKIKFKKCIFLAFLTCVDVWNSIFKVKD